MDEQNQTYYDPMAEQETIEAPKKKGKSGVLIVVLIIVVLVLVCLCGCVLPIVFYLIAQKTLSNNNNGNPYYGNPYYGPVEEKPVIYLYPQEEVQVQVKLSEPDLLLADYPSYEAENGWEVTASPDGTLTDVSGRTYYSLYYESGRKTEVPSWKDAENGFVVKSEDTAAFLEEKLEILGLNEREAEEMIIYWLPTLQQGDYHFIRFETAEEIEANQSLEISPAPDTVIRVMMTMEELTPAEAKTAKETVSEQVLEPVEREGFTVVEWGGALVH